MSPRKAAAVTDGRSLREHLISTAADMIAAQGTAGLTVRAIAKQAGVADGVLYNHFADKEELLARALHEHVRRVQDSLGPLPRPGHGSLAANLATHLEYGLALHKAILPALAGMLNQPAVLDRMDRIEGEYWRDHLAAYLDAERDRLKPDADVESATALLVGVCHETVLAGLLPNAPATKDPDVGRIVTTILDGIVR